MAQIPGGGGDKGVEDTGLNLLLFVPSGRTWLTTAHLYVNLSWCLDLLPIMGLQICLCN
jgi:hypothetical protein